MIFNELNEENFLLFAIKNYENPQAVTKEDFDKDLNHFKYIKRLLKRYRNTGELKVHLILNHFIVLYNIFGEATTPMLFFKIEKELWSVMKKFVIFLNKLVLDTWYVSKPTSGPISRYFDPLVRPTFFNRKLK